MMPSVLACPRPKSTRFRINSDDPDVDLMLRIKRGDQDAFAELTERFGSRIFAHLLRLLPDRQEAEDMTQEVFMRVYRARRRYKPRAKFATWLYHVTQNVARNAIRRRRRQAWLHFSRLEHDEDFGRRSPDPGRDSPSAAIERRELAQAVRGAVAELVGRQRMALEMHQFQHRSYAEIAAALALTPEATKSLLYRARLQLKGHLDALA